MIYLRLTLISLIFLIILTISAQEAERTGAKYATDETWVIVNVPRLNVRSEPSETLFGSVVHTIVKQGEHYPALYFSRDGEWVLISISGDTGWVLRSAVLITNPERILTIGEVSPEEDEAMRQLTAELVAYINSTVGVRNNLNIRLAPGIQYPVLRTIPYNDRAYPVYINPRSTWYQVNYKGTVGWVSAIYITFPPGITGPVVNNNAQG